MAMTEEEIGREKAITWIKLKKKELFRLSMLLFAPIGKNPYLLIRGSKNTVFIENFQELQDNLDLFTEKDARWLASWIEYLGDKQTANRIRETPNEFEEIINERYNQLLEFFHPAKGIERGVR